MDYENLLVGINKDIGLYNFYGAVPGGANQQRAVACIKYALEQVLGWDMEESVKKFDDYMIHVLKLERVVDFIRFPDEVPPRDPRYILSLCYPERVHINLHQLVIETYQAVLDKDAQFPREYFTGANGFYRYCICLQYLIENYHPVSCLDELYGFITSAEGRRFLMQYRLKVPAEQLEINPLDCLYQLTKDEPLASLFYHFYRFQSLMKSFQ